MPRPEELEVKKHILTYPDLFIEKWYDTDKEVYGFVTSPVITQTLSRHLEFKDGKWRPLSPTAEIELLRKEQISRFAWDKPDDFRKAKVISGTATLEIVELSEEEEYPYAVRVKVPAGQTAQVMFPVAFIPAYKQGTVYAVISPEVSGKIKVQLGVATLSGDLSRVLGKVWATEEVYVGRKPTSPSFFSIGGFVYTYRNFLFSAPLIKVTNEDTTERYLEIRRIVFNVAEQDEVAQFSKFLPIYYTTTSTTYEHVGTISLATPLIKNANMPLYFTTSGNIGVKIVINGKYTWEYTETGELVSKYKGMPVHDIDVRTNLAIDIYIKSNDGSEVTLWQFASDLIMPIKSIEYYPRYTKDTISVGDTETTTTILDGYANWEYYKVDKIELTTDSNTEYAYFIDQDGNQITEEVAGAATKTFENIGNVDQLKLVAKASAGTTSSISYKIYYKRVNAIRV